MMNLGDFFTSDVVYRDFTTINAVGVPITFAGTPAIKVMKDDGTTQSAAGVTLVVDLGGTTGLHSVKVDTSADGTFYAAGHDFALVVTAGTVSGQSVIGYVIGTFSIQNRTAVRPTVKGRTLSIAVAGQAGIDWANIGSPTTTLDLSGTTIKNVDNAVPGVSGNVTGSVGSVTGNVGGNVTGSVGSVLGNIAGSVASVVGNVGGNVVGSVNSVVTAVTITAGSIQAIWDALTSALTTVGSIGRLLVTNIDAAISTRAPSATALSTAQWTNARAALLDFLDVTVSSRLAAASYTPPDNADIVAIKAKTDNLPVDPASNSHIDSVEAALQAQIDDVVPGVWNALLADYQETDSMGNTLFKILTKGDTLSAIDGFSFIMLDSTAQNPAPGLTVTATRSIDGGAFAPCENTVTEISDGWYSINLSTSDMNGKTVALNFEATGADVTAITVTIDKV